MSNTLSVLSFIFEFRFITVADLFVAVALPARSQEFTPFVELEMYFCRHFSNEFISHTHTHTQFSAAAAAILLQSCN